jgi:hypothetical protein
VVAGLRWPHRHGVDPAFDEDLAVLVRSVRCPVLTVQPWVEPPGSPPRVAVVGIDRSPEARRAAMAAAELLRASRETRGTRAELILAHGYRTHPAELARRTRWQTLTEGMRIERQPWVVELAESLGGPDLAVEVVVEPAWAPDLVAGLVQMAQADVAGLGVEPGFEGEPASLGYLHRRLLRGMPCPLITTTPARTERRRRRPPLPGW